MKLKRAWHHWIIDAVLFGSFILAFWMDLTDLSLHQWVGVATGVLAGYHLLVHWTWVKTVVARFFKKLARQPRQYFILDTALATSFVLMLGTGLLLSTWLNLTLADYATWRDIHVISSIAGLVLLVLKLILHRRWIVAMAPWRRCLAPVPAPPGPVVDFSRREFLGTMAIIGGLSALALVNATQALTLRGSKAEDSAERPATGERVAPGVPSHSALSPAPSATPSPTRQTLSAIPATATPAAPAAATPVATAIPLPTATPETAPLSCIYLCPRRCSYPGRCRRYTDVNANQRCDWGECWTLYNQQKQTP